MGFLRRARDKRTRPHSFVLLTVIFYKEEGDERWQAECRELGTASYGDTFEDTRERIAEAIELHLNTLEEVGERERFFKERKIKIHALPPSSKEIAIKVPLKPNTFVQPFVQQLAGVH